MHRAAPSERAAPQHLWAIGARARGHAAGRRRRRFRELFLNLEHLLNSLRAQQAREELIGLFEAQSALKKQLLEDLQRAGARALSAAVPRAEALECDAAQREAAAAALGGPTSLAAEDDNAASAAGTGVSLEHLAHAFEAQGQAAVPRQPG